MLIMKCCNFTAVSLAPTNHSILDAIQEVRDVIMLREAEAAALEAKKINNNKQKQDSDSKKENECNDICAIC